MLIHYRLMTMNKIPMSPAMISPNMEPKEKRGQGVLEKQREASERKYDALVARTETFVTPDGREGKVVIYSRASPSQLLAMDAERRVGSGALAKSHIEKNVERLKINQERKQQLLDLMRVKIKGNFSRSSDTHLGAEAVRNLKSNLKVNSLPIAKQVRFVDSANSNIPARVPSSIDLPPLPSDD